MESWLNSDFRSPLQRKKVKDGLLHTINYIDTHTFEWICSNRDIAIVPVVPPEYSVLHLNFAAVPTNEFATKNVIIILDFCNRALPVISN